MLSLTNLSGFGGAILPPTTLSFITERDAGGASITGLSLTVASGIQAGDLLVLAVYASGGTFTILTQPAGYTLVTAGSTGASVSALAYKIADGTENGVAQTFSANGTAATSDGILLQFRGDNPIRSIIAGTPNGASSATLAPGAFTVAVSPLLTPVMCLCYWTGSGAVGTRGMSPAKDAEVTNVTNRLYVGYKIYNAGSTPVDNNVTSSDNGNDNITRGIFLQAA